MRLESGVKERGEKMGRKRTYLTENKRIFDANLPGSSSCVEREKVVTRGSKITFLKGVAAPSSVRREEVLKRLSHDTLP